MKCRLFKVLTAISLAVCVGIAIAQYRGSADLFTYASSPSANGQRWFQLTTCQSRLSVEWYIVSINTMRDSRYVPVARGFQPASEFYMQLSLATFSSPRGRIIDTQLFFWSISIWWTIVSTSVLLAIQVLLWLKSKRPSRDHCVSCGYDLRATPDRCPECGRVTPHS
jgi:hypothetical protein